jgi:NAD(P)-dependent dehydrogenase (short-subunit alcohol dehydrogenase family)
LQHKYNGRAAIVTGASSGIGRSIALRLGAAGMDLWLVARSREGLQETAAAIQGLAGKPAQCEAMDLRQKGAISALIARVGSLHPHLFAVVNNAGVMHPEPIMSGRMDRWQAMFDINVLAPVEACKAAVEVMRKQGANGHLINIGSVAARFDNGGVYGASKLALEMIGRSLREELEHDNIRITTIVPGGFATQLGRHVEPETWSAIAGKLQGKGLSFEDPNQERLIGNPDEIAKTIEFVLDQSIDINFEQIVIRPPVNSSW